MSSRHASTRWLPRFAPGLPAPLPAALLLAAGIALAGSSVAVSGALHGARGWAIAGVLGVLAFRAAPGRARRAGLVSAMLVALGLARGALPPVRLPPGVGVDDRVVDRVEGVITGPVVSTPRGSGARLEPADAAAVWAWFDVTTVQPGERVAITGLVRTPRGSLGPGQADRAAALHARAARLEVTAQTVERIADEPDAIDRIWRWAAATQHTWSRAIAEAGDHSEASAALRGLAVGDRRDVPAALDTRWRIVGIFHVLSVSGLHLAAIAGLAYALLRRVLAATPLGGRMRPARLAAPIALGLAVAYTLVTGAQIATLRALVVIALMLGAAMLDRPLRLVDALGVAALLILAARPGQLADPGFQLSFVAALVLGLMPGDPRRGVRAWLRKGVRASVWVTLATAPITAQHFHELAVGGVVGNLALAPVLELVALPLALVGVVLDWSPLLVLATGVVTVIDHLAGWLAVAMPVGHVALASPLVAALLVALVIALAARGRRSRVDGALWLAVCAAWAFGRSPPPADALRVTFLDVGQGDAAILELPDGEVWLVDAGGIASARDPVAASSTGQTIRRTLAAFNHAHVDVAIISHPHPDHYLGLGALGVPIGELWAAAEEATGGGFARVVTELAARGTRLVHPPLGRSRGRGGVELAVLGPRYAHAPAPLLATSDPVRSVNDNSLVITVTYAGRTVLFAGDLEREGEDVLVASGLGAVDVVKVPHHGSPTSSSEPFVAATRPVLAVISCGVANAFGFPSPAVVARWQAIGAQVARTDRDGAITVVVDATGALAVDRFVSAPE